MNLEFINVKVEAEKDWGITFKLTFGVAAYPTYLYFDPSGNMIFSGLGSIKAEDFLEQDQNVLYPT